jgi:hypothetical protein
LLLDGSAGSIAKERSGGRILSSPVVIIPPWFFMLICHLENGGSIETNPHSIDIIIIIIITTILKSDKHTDTLILNDKIFMPSFTQ